MHQKKNCIQTQDCIYEVVTLWDGNSYKTVYRPMYLNPPQGASVVYGECNTPPKKEL